MSKALRFLQIAANLGNLQEFFGQMVYRPPWPKIAHTPMEETFRSDWQNRSQWTILKGDSKYSRLTEPKRSVLAKILFFTRSFQM